MKYNLLILLLFAVVAFVIYNVTDAKWFVYVPLILGALFVIRPLIIGVVFMLIPNPKDQFYKSYMDSQLARVRNNMSLAINKDVGKERWVLARPLPFYCFKYRLRQAWDVLRYKADAFYWHEQ